MSECIIFRTEEGEEIPHHLFAIGFGTDLDGTQDFFQMYWPMVLSHRSARSCRHFVVTMDTNCRIDESSPLWTMSPDSLKEEKFEIILTLEGIVPETGNNIQAENVSYFLFTILFSGEDLLPPH